MKTFISKFTSHFANSFSHWTTYFALTMFFAVTIGCTAHRIVTSKKATIDPFKSFNFSISDSASLFKYSKNGTIMFWYCIGGGHKENYTNEPFFNLIILPNERTLLEEAISIGDFMKNQTIKNESNVTTNGLPSLQREVYGEMNGKPAVLFQHLVLIDDKVIVMSGIADNNFDKYVIEFKKLSSTIKKK